MNVMTSSLARGLSSILSQSENLFRERMRELYGEIGVKIAEYDRRYTPAKWTDSVVSIHRACLKMIGYNFIGILPIAFRGRSTLYHILFASKAKNAAKEWFGRYMNYLREKTPEDYETLKTLWLQASGRAGYLK